MYIINFIRLIQYILSQSEGSRILILDVELECYGYR